MATYEFVCHECKLIWEKQGSMHKPPQRAKCAECKKFGSRFYGTAPPVIFKCDGFRDPGRKRARNRKNKDNINEFYNEEIASSTKRQNSDGGQYRHFTINMQDQLDRGLMKKVSDDKYKRRRKVAKKSQHDAYKLSGYDTDVLPSE